MIDAAEGERRGQKTITKGRKKRGNASVLKGMDFRLESALPGEDTHTRGHYSKSVEHRSCQELGEKLTLQVDDGTCL